jgi:hypothetical protein
MLVVVTGGTTFKITFRICDISNDSYSWKRMTSDTDRYKYFS